MKLVYNVKDKPKFGQLLIFAFQQLLAILAATILVPALINQNVGSDMSQAAALFGAGVGTIVYLLFTKFKSPVFLGSSFAFIGSMCAAFAGAASAAAGYAGFIIGAVLAGLVYVIIALIVKFAGVKWINKIMPAVVIGPTVAIIGLSLAKNAIKQVLDFPAWDDASSAYVVNQHTIASLVCALITLLAVVIASVYGKKMSKLIPFIIGILVGYAVACIFTWIGDASENEALKLVDFTALKEITFIKVPEFTFTKAMDGFSDITGSYIATLAVAYIPVAFVVFAEHIADHKNLSSVIEKDLLEEPGLDKTLLGDGVGSMAGAFFGGCPNTTYGESVGCVAITGNASVVTIFTTAIMAIAISFIDPFVKFLSTIPNCVMGGVCITLYGFIAVSGLKMLQPVDLNDNRNLFTASSILISGVGQMAFKIVFNVGNEPASIVITEVAAALILGMIVNFICSFKKKGEEK